MKTKKIAFDGKALKVNMEEYLSQHDIIYRTPGTEGYEGFPLGNGDLGVMAWTPSERLHFQINKTNTWDDAPDGSFGSWDDGNKANAYTALRHCGEVRISPGVPAFDWMYLQDFQGKLSLANAKASWYAKSPFGQVQCSCFVAREPRVIVIEYNDQLNELGVRKIELARWGTRIFEHWYSMIKRDNFLGPEGTIGGIEDNELWIYQPMRSVNFAVAAKIVGHKIFSGAATHRQVSIELEASLACRFTMYVAVVTSEESDDPLREARDIVHNAAKENEGRLLEKHKHRWSDFWSKSLISIPDKYLENLWYSNLYQTGASSQGSYPPHFIGSLWSWNRDVRPWNHYYHWNQQCYTWPLLSSGHSELLEPYAKWRLEGLAHAIEDAKAVHGCNGAFYSDVANRKGYQDVVAPKDFKPTVDDKWLQTYTVIVKYNFTPGAQIAHDLYKHYQYTLDSVFLEKYTYPILREWVRFIFDCVKKGDDGFYHVPLCDPYESPHVRCMDTTNILAYIKLLFPIFVDVASHLAVDSDLAKRAMEVHSNLADFVYMELPDYAKRLPAKSTIVAAGLDIESHQPLFSESPLMHGEYTNFIECAQLTPIFPAGIVGMDEKGTPEFTAFHTTMRYCMPFPMNGHTPSLNWLARMGESELLSKELVKWAQNHQMYPQGLWNYWQKRYPPVLKGEQYEIRGSAADFLNVGAANRAKVVGQEEYVNIPKAPFAHAALEAGGIFQAAVNDMLLGGYTDKIRVFPATPKEWDAKFTLHAVNGFVVTSEQTQGEVSYIAIQSRCGKQCSVINPWPATEVQVREMQSGRTLFITLDDLITFSTEAGRIYVLECIAAPLSSYEVMPMRAEPNMDCKMLGDAVLGKPRQF